METDFENEKSKSQIKRDLLELQEFGKQLHALPNKTLAELPLSDSLREALHAAKSMERSALRRQLRHIGGLLRNEDSVAIRQSLLHIQHAHKTQVQTQHQIETWRDALLVGDENLLNDLVTRLTGADRQHLRQLIRNANKEKSQNKPPKSARMLFQYLLQLYNDSL